MCLTLFPALPCPSLHPQCKPQCEDTSKSSPNPKCGVIPTCKVTGCGLCSTTSSAVCEKCWAGYILNLKTRTCDCASGYYVSSTSTSWSCKLCPAGSIPYGGAATACTACPAGRIANKEQSECVLASSWDHWGYDLTNRRWGYGERTLNVGNIASIQPKWTFTAGSDVTATPTVSNGWLYVPDWSGKLWCLDAVTGMTIWNQTIYDLVLQVDPTPYPPASPGTVISRTSPAISGNYLVGSHWLQHMLHRCLDCMKWHTDGAVWTRSPRLCILDEARFAWPGGRAHM